MFWCSNIQGTADSRATAPPRVSQFLQIVRNSPANILFKSKSTNPEPTSLATTFVGLSVSTCLSHSRPGAHQLGISPVPQSPLKLFKPPISSLLTLPHQLHNKRLAHSFLSPDQPWCSSAYPLTPMPWWHMPSSWELWVTDCLFKSNHFLICWPYDT